MKIIKPEVQFFGEVPTNYDSALRFIEMAGRTCYKSEDKITEGSAEKFVRKLIAAGHLAMVEHSNFVVKIQRQGLLRVELDNIKAICGKYLNIHAELYDGEVSYDTVYVGGNLTAWYQRAHKYGFNPMFDPFYEVYGDLFILALPGGGCGQWQVCPYDEIPNELHRFSAKFICDRGVSHELVRHRPTAMDWFGEFVDSPLPLADHKFLDASFAQESTRYVNYSGKDMEFIEPAGFEDWRKYIQRDFAETCQMSEGSYNYFLSQGLKPQQARAVLPNALKTEIVITADAAEWKHIKTLRTAPYAHPDMQRIMNMIPWESFLDD